MRGKSVDTEYVSSFVEECVTKDKNSPEEIVSEARIKISQIDMEIRRADQLKIERTKLIDVVNSFDPEGDKLSAANNETYKVANDISDLYTDKILEIITNNTSATVNDFYAELGEAARPRIFLAIKKLAEAGIIVRNSAQQFVPGPQWIAI